jgi:hypothetical protein
VKLVVVKNALAFLFLFVTAKKDKCFGAELMTKTSKQSLLTIGYSE